MFLGSYGGIADYLRLTLDITHASRSSLPTYICHVYKVIEIYLQATMDSLAVISFFMSALKTYCPPNELSRRVVHLTKQMQDGQGTVNSYYFYFHSSQIMGRCTLSF